MNPIGRRREHSIGINPAVLKWAREWRGRTAEEAAGKINKQASDIFRWEEGDGSPTVKQARDLAEFYGRPFLELFLPTPPEIMVPTLVPDYRMHAGQKPASENRELQEIQQWAEAKRLDALDLFREIGSDPPDFPSFLFSTIQDDVEAVASRTREAMSFTIFEQMELTARDAEALPIILRNRLEALGVLTLRRPDLKDFQARGISIAIFPLPVVVVQNEANTAQAFTLMHEFGHILLQESAITGERAWRSSYQPVEEWCDRYAAAFLMPKEQIAALLGPHTGSPNPSIPDEKLNEVARILRVSPHATLIRLVQLGFVDESYYWEVKKPQFDESARNVKSFARAKFYGARYRSRLGDLYTGLVLEAWSSGRISNHNAAEYMDIKRISHLDDLRREFKSA